MWTRSSRQKWTPRGLINPVYVPQERRHALILACILFWSVLLFLGVNRFVLGSVEVVGTSMVPTLQEGERYVINRWLYLVTPPLRGDIVVIHDPEMGDQAVKRIVGLPGELIEIGRDGIRVNGRRLSEPYLPRRMYTSPFAIRNRKVRIPVDSYFVVGDNRPVSQDSRSYGPIPRRYILGPLAPMTLGG